MDFGRAFSFAFEDQDWLKKIGIAALLMIIPIIGTFLVMGWGIEITRRVIRRDPEPLPDWNDFGGYLVKGLQAFVIGFVYALPIFLIMICPVGVSIAAGQDSGDTMASIAALVMTCFGCLVFLYSLFMALVIPAALGNFAATDEMGAAFRFADVIALVRANPMSYVLVFLGSIVTGIIAPLGSILCVIGMFATAAYASVVNSHLYGQAYLEASASKQANDAAAF